MKNNSTFIPSVCEIYKKARFVNKTIIRQIPGEKEIVYSYMDCVKIKGLIIGGEPAKLKEFPHMVRIFYHYLILIVYYIIRGIQTWNRVCAVYNFKIYFSKIY